MNKFIYPILVLCTVILFAVNIIVRDKTISVFRETLAVTQQNLDTLEQNKITLEEQLASANAHIENIKSASNSLIYLGDFKLTHYCSELYEHICGTGDGLTATGTQVTPGRTIAVDPTIIPYGSEVYIEGCGWFVAEDCGGAIKGNHIDIAVETHEQALNMGVKTGGVWILIK